MTVTDEDSKSVYTSSWLVQLVTNCGYRYTLPVPAKINMYSTNFAQNVV